MVSASIPGARQQRVYAFFDLREIRRGLEDAVDGAYELDWDHLVPWLATEAVAATVGLPVADLRPVGASVYVPAGGAAGAGALRWASLMPIDAPGITVVLEQDAGVRQQYCGGCNLRTGTCGGCGLGRVGGGEGGLAVRSDLLRWSRDDAFDWAVLVSADTRLVPVVDFLATRGRRVVHAGFPPRGARLAAACSGAVDLGAYLERLLRA